MYESEIFLSFLNKRHFRIENRHDPTLTFIVLLSSVMSRVKIYTKTGDRGTSSLFNGERRSKSDAVFEALGNVDELNAAIGLCYEHALIASHNELASQLTTIQSTLLDLGSHIATPKTSEASDEKRLERAKFDAEPLITMLENSIDEWDKELPALRNFILPVRSVLSLLHNDNN